MRQRETHTYAIELTYNEEAIAGVSDYLQLMESHKRELCASLRKMAGNHDWGYEISIYPSLWKGKSCKTVSARPHFHIVIKANPAFTVVRWICAYWAKRGYGFTYNTKCYYVPGAVEYAEGQAVKVWNQSKNAEILETTCPSESPEIETTENDSNIFSSLIDNRNYAESKISYDRITELSISMSVLIILHLSRSLGLITIYDAGFFDSG